MDKEVIQPQPQPQHLVFIGDTHGGWNYIGWKVKTYTKQEITEIAFVHVGDFGIGFSSAALDWKELTTLNKNLKDGLHHLYVIRGNDDDPVFFRGDVLSRTYKKNTYTFEFSNLHFVEDYSVLNICDKNILCIGGAKSTDILPSSDLTFSGKPYQGRTQGVDWWEDEVLVIRDVSH